MESIAQLPWSFYFFLGMAVALLLFMLLRRPRQNRPWCPEHSKPATIHIDPDGEVTIENVVHAKYHGRFQADVRHHQWRFRLSDIEEVALVLEYFPVALPWGGQIEPAHAFLSFALSDGRVFSVSVAGRRLQNEGVGFARILPHYKEIFYKIIQEKDTLIARAYFEKDPVYLYPLNLTQKQRENLFRDIAKTVNTLAKKPAWFDTFTRNCTTEAMRHLRRAGAPVPRFHIRYILTAGVEEVLAKRQVLKTRLSWPEAKKHHLITPLIQQYKEDPNLSLRIRHVLATAGDK